MKLSINPFSTFSVQKYNVEQKMRGPLAPATRAKADAAAIKLCETPSSITNTPSSITRQIQNKIKLFMSDYRGNNLHSPVFVNHYAKATYLKELCLSLGIDTTSLSRAGLGYRQIPFLRECADNKTPFHVVPLESWAGPIARAYYNKLNPIANLVTREEPKGSKIFPLEV